MLYKKSPNGIIECFLCAHFCKIADGKFGFCGVRQQKEGKLYTHAYGEVIASHVDPVEKKPLYHFLPGSLSYSIATRGCNFKCGFCQNWQISQLAVKSGTGGGSCELKPEEVVREARKNKCKSISYTYTEPTIFFEYAYDTSRLAKKEGIYNIFVTNGFMTKQMLEAAHPFLDAANVDLKTFSDETYKKVCHGRLQPVLDSIKLMHKLNIWVEITTLVIPGMNDSDAELSKIADFIASVDTEIPWHVSGFHPDYKFVDAAPTPVSALKKAEAIGKKAGLHHVYMGNVWGESPQTLCYGCKEVLVKRSGYIIEKNSIESGKCPKCGKLIKGVWQ